MLTVILFWWCPVYSWFLSMTARWCNFERLGRFLLLSAWTQPRYSLCVGEVVRVFQNCINVRNTVIYRNWLYVLYLYRASTWYDDLAQYNWLSSLPSDGARGLRDGARDSALDDNDGCHVQNSIQSQVMVNGILPDPLISKWMNCPKPNFYELCFTIYGFFTKFVANEKTNLSSSICSTLIHRHFQYLSIFT